MKNIESIVMAMLMLAAVIGAVNAHIAIQRHYRAGCAANGVLWAMLAFIVFIVVMTLANVTFGEASVLAWLQGIERFTVTLGGQ